MLSICILYDNFGPYHFSRLKAASQSLKIRAIQFSASSSDYAWRQETLDGIQMVTIVPEGPWSSISREIFIKRLCTELDRISPDLIAVPGWSSVGALAAISWAVHRNVPFVLMSESTFLDAPRVAVKEFIKRQIVSLATSALVGGNPHSIYMNQLGMPESRIFLGYDAVDNFYFADQAEKWKRKEDNVCKSPYFLLSNRFVAKKNLFRILDAYKIHLVQLGVSDNSNQFNSSRVQSENYPWDLCLLGDGALRQRLLAHCQTLGLNVVMAAPWERSHSFDTDYCSVKTRIRYAPTVYFPGFRQIEELPRFYAHAGAFVHGSTIEQWGLVVNEAMATGLPVLVSDRVGCAQDLVENGVNGFTFDPYMVDELAGLFMRISHPSFPLSEFGASSRRIIAKWGPDRFAAALSSASIKSTEIGPNKCSLTTKVLLKILLRYRSDCG